MRAANPRASSERTNEILRVLIENVNGALVIIEPRDLRFLEINDRAVVTLGYSKAEFMKLPADRVFPRNCSVLRSILGQPDGPVAEKAKVLTKDEKFLDVNLSAHRVEFRGQDAILLMIAEPGEIERHSENRKPENDQADLDDLVRTTVDFPAIVGQSPQIREVCRLIGLVAKTDATVLIQGETGTGKELIAQAIHFHSHRSQGPLIKVNCAALTETLLESELFGHKKGSFTGAIQDRKGRFKLADGGTIILDEIGSMSLAGQAKLLRVLQEKEFEPLGESRTVRVDVRIVAVTNNDLVRAIEERMFRDDLYYRLSTFPIYLPPLRERKVDIPLLARYFLKDGAVSARKGVDDIDSAAISILMDYSWPGNIRELKNAIEQAVILEQGRTLKASSLPDKLGQKNDQQFSLRDQLEFAERQIIIDALTRSNGVKKRAAKILGIDHRNLGYFLHKHGIH